jgi:DNA polymerase
MARSTQTYRLAELAEQSRCCTLCPLHTSRTHAVPGDGKVTAKVMLIGEAPGREEDQSGRPFVGAAGRFLDRVLAEHGLDRQELFITNVVKCRPAQNRAPRKGERDTCVSHYLAEQIALIDPVVIMLLGSIAAQQLLGVKSVNEARGRLIAHNQRHYVVGYHPAAMFYREDMAAKVYEDFAVLARAVHELVQE